MRSASAIQSRGKIGAPDDCPEIAPNPPVARLPPASRLWPVARCPAPDRTRVTRAVAHPPRVVIAGAGLMGRWHADAARRAGAQVVAAADPDRARAARIAPASYADLQEMLAATTPDLLHLCTPTATHGALLRLAAAQGVHAFAEKPLAADLAETRALLDAAGAAGTRLCPVHQYAFQSSIETILRRRDRLGDPVLIELAFFSAGAEGQPTAAQPTAAQPTTARLATIAADILPHPLSILQRLFPGPLPAAALWQIAQPGPATFALQTTLAGALVRITLSLSARPTRATLDLYGTSGAFTADLFHDYGFFRDGSASRRSKLTRPLRDGAGHFGHACLNLAGRALRRETAYPGLAALTARVYASLDGGAPEPILPGQILEIAALRDDFLARTGGMARTSFLARSGGTLP